MFNRQFQFRIILIFLIVICLSYIKGFTIHNEYLQNEKSLDLCGRCKKTIGNIINDLSNFDFQLKWEIKLVNGCKYTGPLRDNCASLFSSTIIKIINKFIGNIKADKVCEDIFACSI
ncbi:unnamed protein product [Schistosoma rodhaini]|uniref:Saposin B-type domain-containing protein n=1 Tax=Schistosoma rodhaini TaxID=6188 RepID=A0AA85FGE3_9TREM|nr:unnamed protein product [Schistosoma rodhaini]